MATIYCRSTDGDDASDGSTWALAKATLAAAVTAAGAGGLVYVSQAHAESNAVNITISAGTAGSPAVIICVNDGAEPPTTLATTATVTTTGMSDIYFEGFMYFYGITFNCGTGTGTGAPEIYLNTGSPGSLYFENCNLVIISTDTCVIAIGPLATASPDDASIVLKNTNVQFAAVGQYLSLRTGYVLWDGGTITGATIPTILFGGNVYSMSNVTVQGVDLSALGSNAIVDVSSLGPVSIKILNCKLGASTPVISGTIVGPGGARVCVENSDSGATNNRIGHYRYEGSIIKATNCILNTDYSMKMISLATGAKYYSPLISPPIAQWNSSVGTSLKATVEIISTATLEDDEIWLEIEYLGSASYPISSIANDRHEHHIVSLVSGTGNGTAQTTSTAAWTEDLTSEIKQKLEVTFTPNMAGYVIGKVYLAKANQTVYVDPYMTIGVA